MSINSSLPSTIAHPETFMNSLPAGFDGCFDWAWTEGCFGKGKITPMDFDGVVERKGNFLVFETKNIGVPVPQGQIYTYESAYKLGCFSIFFIEGKLKPEYAKVWLQPGFKKGLIMKKPTPIVDMEKFKNLVTDWYKYADTHPHKTVDISFLNKKVTDLNNILNSTKQHLTEVVKILGGTVIWPA